MPNLKKGSTIGGFAIITEADENQHVHDVSDIDGLGDGATADTGPGSDFDADTLNGLHYSDMVQNFVNIDGDSILGNVSITDVPNTDFSAISRKYTMDYLSESVIVNSPSIPFVSISQSSTLSYNETNDEVNLSGGDILIGGSFYSFNNLSISLVPTNNTTFYIYAQIVSGSIEMVIESDYIEHDFSKIMIGTVSFDGSSQASVNQRNVMCNLHGISMNELSTPYSMILSDSSGNVDSNWFNSTASGFADTINLKGETTISSEGEESYTITDYDQYSTYSVSSDIGSVSIDDNTITVSAPAVTQQTTLILSVTRNGSTLQFNIEVSP